MSKAIDFDKVKDELIAKGTELISKVVKDATDGTVTIESIVSGKIKIDANAYVDKAVLLLNEKLESNNLNALDLPDLANNFEHVIACGIALPGNVDIHDGCINGLANFCRTGDSELKISVQSSPIISARARIGIQNSNVEYAGKITLLCFGPNIKILGTLTDVSLEIELSVEKNFVVNVNKFAVSSDGDLKLEFENLEAFDYLSEKLSQDLAVNVKKAVLEYLEKSVKERLDIVVSSLPLLT